MNGPLRFFVFFLEGQVVEAPIISAMATQAKSSPDLRCRSLFDLPSDFFDSCGLVSPLNPLPSPALLRIPATDDGRAGGDEVRAGDARASGVISCWSCNTCKQEFDSLQDQRSHFKSDLHKFNVKLNLSGRRIITEEEFDEKLISESLFEDCDLSSISGSEDEVEDCNTSQIGGASEKGDNIAKSKLFFHLNSGDLVSLWKCLIHSEHEDHSNNFYSNKFAGHGNLEEMVDRLRSLICEPRDMSRLRIVLLASGGHFAGCVFDGVSIVAHKTFHRYVVRAKAGNRQSSKDATGKAAKSAGSSLRRYNELALKKDVQELLTAWKPYFDATTCVLIHAPSNNRQLFYDGDKSVLNDLGNIVRGIPLTVRRPTFKETKRIYNQLTTLTYETEVTVQSQIMTGNPEPCNNNNEGHDRKNPVIKSDGKAGQRIEQFDSPDKLAECSSSTGLATHIKPNDISTESTENQETALHEAAKSGDPKRTLELLEQGLDPCVKDSRGRTPYMLASEKEVRNTFRRFMGLNLDKWDWKVANVPSALTKDMEETQAAKQAEKDAKRKAKAKEMKKLKKAKEKAQAKAQAEADAQVQKYSSLAQGSRLKQNQELKRHPMINAASNLSKEDEQKRAQAEEREKRAAAAERRIAAMKSSTMQPACIEQKFVGSTTSTSTTTSTTDGINCSCCATSLAGKIPFHRYHYKYCSTSCMHVHREMLEDG